MIILSLDTKKCMSQLLVKEAFDSFSFIEGEIITYNKFSIDGFIRKDFYEDPPDRDYSLWSSLREYCFSIIKGKQTPLSFKLILSLTREDFPKFLDDQQLTYRPEEIQGLYLNFRYDGTHLSCITGTSTRTFTMDKSLDAAWDTWARQYFSKVEIPFEEE